LKTVGATLTVENVGYYLATLPALASCLASTQLCLRISVSQDSAHQPCAFEFDASCHSRLPGQGCLLGHKCVVRSWCFGRKSVAAKLRGVLHIWWKSHGQT